MASLKPGNIKNIALCGHGSSGKTSLAEALLLLNGETDRLGKVDDGNTFFDFDPEEIKRKASLGFKMTSFMHGENKINLIDTPGMFDFSAGMSEGIRACDSVIICLSGKSGITVGAEKAYKLAKKAGKSIIFFISKLDSPSADCGKVLDSLKAVFGPVICPVVIPKTVENKVESYIDLITMKAFKYSAGGKKEECPIPDMGGQIEELVAAMSESVAEADEKLFEKYFSGEQFVAEEILSGLKQGVKTGGVVPVLCGSALDLSGVDLLLQYAAELFPAASDAAPEELQCGSENVKLSYDDSSSIAALVFKTVADPFVGKLTYIKVLSGTLRNDTILTNSRTKTQEKLPKLLFVKGKKTIDAAEVCAGDICAVAKLQTAETGDTLCQPPKTGSVNAIEFEKPSLSMAIVLEGKGDESKIAGAISRILEEDRTLKFENNAETHEQIISGLGEQHLDVTVSKLKSKFGISVKLLPPTVPYRETITKKIKVQGRHKKQTGGHGQFGDVHIEFEPTDSETLVFEEKVFGGAVPKGFFPAVEKGLEDCIKHGVLAGYPVVGLKATLVDGSYHPVDSSEMAFKLAASIAYREGMKIAGPVLLEPIGTLVCFAPDNNTGDIIGELNKRRGRMLGMAPDEEGLQKLEAEVPLSEMHDFSVVLRSITGGRGWFELEFARYERLPGQLEAAVIASAPKRSGSSEG